MPKSEMPPTEDTAVDAMKEAILQLQAMLSAMHTIRHCLQGNSGYSQRELSKDVSQAFDTVNAHIHDKLNQAWNNLSWFAGISPRADETLMARTRSWFESENGSVMEFLGHRGSYYIEDEKAFKKRVMELLDLKKNGDQGNPKFEFINKDK